MVDIHVHFLPKIDDGANSMEECLSMLESAEKSGTTDIICTPHFNLEEQNLDDFLHYRQEVFDKVKAEASNRGLKINLHQGAEVYFLPTLIDMIIKLQNEGSFDKIKKLCLNGSRYMLLELPFFTPPIWVERSIYELQLRGIFPVIAHLERYNWVNSMKKRIIKWVNQGSIIQINASDLLEQRVVSKDSAMKFILESEIVHVIASDAHDSKRRSTSVLGEVMKEQRIQKIDYDKIKNNVFNILEDYDIIIKEAKIKKSFIERIFNRKRSESQWME